MSQSNALHRRASSRRELEEMAQQCRHTWHGLTSVLQRRGCVTMDVLDQLTTAARILLGLSEILGQERFKLAMGDVGEAYETETLRPCAGNACKVCAYRKMHR